MIPPKIIRQIEVYKKLQINDLEVNLKEYHRLLCTLVYLHETISELKIEMPNWKTYSDTLMSKFYLHSFSFYNSLSGIEIKSEYFKDYKYEKKIIDVPSAIILLRAKFEAFFMYHHIYVNPKTDDEKELRFNAWIYTSLLHRQSHPSNTDFAKAQKSKDLKEIENMKVMFKNSPAFNSLTPKQQKGLLEKGSDKLFRTWDMIMNDTGFDERHGLSTYYSLLSNYAHSEGLSILQLKQSKLGYDKTNQEANTNLLLAKQLICLMIISIKNLYKIIEIKFNALPQELQDTIEIYSEIARTAVHNPQKK